MVRQNPGPVSAFGGKTTRSTHLFALASEGQSLAVLPAAGERGDPRSPSSRPRPWRGSGFTGGPGPRWSSSSLQPLGDMALRTRPRISEMGKRRRAQLDLTLTVATSTKSRLHWKFQVGGAGWSPRDPHRRCSRENPGLWEGPRAELPGRAAVCWRGAPFSFSL